jgi:adenosylmethionine-8-amino-7-oxononanoate aminotransferase
MTQTEQALLQDIVRVAQTGHDFFADVGPRANEIEVRAAFAYVADVKRRLIHSLVTWAPPAHNAEPGNVSVATVEKLYADARRHLRPEAPASIAHALMIGEDQLIKLTERAFRGTRVPALRQLLKASYPELSICRQTMSRLQARLAA